MIGIVVCNTVRCYVYFRRQIKIWAQYSHSLSLGARTSKLTANIRANNTDQTSVNVGNVKHYLIDWVLIFSYSEMFA